MEQPSHDCDLIFEEARQLLEEQRYEDAVQAFSDFITLVPESEGAYGNRGLAHMHLGDDNQAIQDFEMVLRLNQDDAMGYAMLAEALRNQGRWAEALAAAVNAMERDDEVPEAYFVRGWLFARAGQYAPACEDLERFVEQIDEPGEGEDLLDACRTLAEPGAVDDEGQPLDDPPERERFLRELGLSFDFDYNVDYEGDELFCPYAHCIRNMPRRALEAAPACPLTGHECPGGAEQADVCREYPPET